ncbi:RdgB/HAM1 family non-canonical purine NTP pyrophosphatase [Bacteroidia bacterium]|nr:RdgB/HAM1 family non-canonical purine NTP pyrophosphatase [Bacteroidia bacterium]
MATWVFATNNNHKLEEARSILPNRLGIVSLKDVGFLKEVDETSSTFSGNAELKARAVFEEVGKPCFADDSGLCVTALNLEPGVRSARYSSETGPVDHLQNNLKLLKNLKHTDDRSAYFITVICLIDSEGQTSFYEGRVFGEISREMKGVHGFGYDPLFIPQGYDQTFAELGEGVKNKLSHRSVALRKMVEDIG